MNKKKVIYCDMDGVLADFNAEPNGVNRFRTEKHFFYNLKPIEENVAAVKSLSKQNVLYILTASPNARCDRDKKKWIKRHMPFINMKQVIICRNGQKKVDFMKSETGILFDDYGKNCREWVGKMGNYSFKVSEEKNISYWLLTLNELQKSFK